MICSEARLAANRRNAKLSTGPRTPEGKAISRANSLKHGLCATVVVPEDLDVIQSRAEDIYEALKPQDQYQAMLVNNIAIWSVRANRCERIERRLRDKVSLRAELTWEEDRRLEAEVLGGLLAERPAETVEALRLTPQGCEWLMTRWAMLAHAADTNHGDWTEDQSALAFDLLGTPAPFRLGCKPGVALDFEGRVLESAEDGAAVARRQVAELKERRETVAGLDEVERTLAAVDMDHDSDPELRRLRRYESMLQNRIRWAIAEVRKEPFYRPTIPGLRPGWLARPPAGLKPEPLTEDEKLAAKHPSGSIHPPFCLEPDEFPPKGQKADIPAVLRSRREKRIRKAESKRDDRRRKIEKLRA